MNQKKILFLDHAAALGGAEKSLLLLLSHMDRSKWTPVLGCRNGDLMANAADLGIEIRQFDFHRLRQNSNAVSAWRETARRIAEYCQEAQVAVLHANTVRAALYGAGAASQSGIPFIWHMRDFWLTEKRPNILLLDRLAKRWIGRFAARIIANSKAVAYKMPFPKKTTVVYNGIDLQAFSPELNIRPFAVNSILPGHFPVIGMVGRLRPWKGHHSFLSAAARISSGNPEARFIIVGGSPLEEATGYAQDLRQYADEIGLAGRVSFTGHLEDVRPALAAMDIFVHAGDPEPFGLVNIEAMAMAKPVVAFAHGALPEIVVDSRTGCLVRPYDISGLADTIDQLLQDPERMRILGRAARKRVEDVFDIKDTTASIENVWDQVAA